MNSIVFTQFVTPVQGASCLDIPLHRLGADIDAEIGSLEYLLDISGLEDAIDDIGALSELHLAADASREDIDRLLESAVAPLERLLARVRTIPLDGPLAGPAPSDFDAWLRWPGARLEDILATLRHALAT
ncbi:hypothetical protein [Roseovarius indicus]|uniref:Uncharacterized protein n=1 Tax=Roseovarius indicus TaxID=540747 RepID=A0A0T5PCF0_9RHOB|nr:hypothetical protein [Roseovarius indicus]KRS18967.1 hypothetical protein XM52_04645 [Roseovarius indicus]QEW26100.1 hypothetical protein RIdsm_01894 [Roseovarius indicus]SFD93257.1 hypothetical protein SAMN04488031_103307 [Roseovarius indicus]